MKQILVIILIYASLALAGITSLHIEPVGKCGMPSVEQFDAAAYLENLRKNDPAAYQILAKQIQAARKFNSVNADTRQFFAYDFTKSNYYEVMANLHYTGSLVRIWVADNSEQYVTDAVITELANALEVASGSSSIYPDKGIVDIDTTLFGQPPNFDGDGIIDFLILDIKDSFNPPDDLSFIAGYFSPSDQVVRNLQTSPYSNAMDLMYLDSYPGIFYEGQHRTNRVLSTTAHELQHLIQYRYDKREEKWVNEGLSELAGTYCGYGLDSPSLYLNDTRRSLIQWNDEVADYARVNLWTVYCAEQLGLPFIKTLTQLPEHGIAGFNKAMELGGISGDISNVFTNWVLANTINNTGVDPRYGYQLAEAQNLKAEPAKTVSEFPATVNGNIDNFGVEYHQLFGRDSLQFDFSSGMHQSQIIEQVRGTEDNYNVIPIGSDHYIFPNFGVDTTYSLALFSTTSDLYYEYAAAAKYSSKYVEASYDDNHAEVVLNFTGIAANRFSVSDKGLSLTEVRFWTGTKGYTARVHVYGQTANRPGTELMAPMDVPVTTENSWITVELTQPITGLTLNSTIYVGIEITASGNGLGLDVSTANQNYSYIRLGSFWDVLSNKNYTDGTPIEGVWMIRAVFMGLAPSNPGGAVTRLELDSNYPNPFVEGQQNTFFRYRLPEPGKVQLTLYNVLGQKVASVEKVHSISGPISVGWDQLGLQSTLPSGVYFYRIIYTAQDGSRQKSKFQKLLLIK